MPHAYGCVVDNSAGYADYSRCRRGLNEERRPGIPGGVPCRAGAVVLLDRYGGAGTLEGSLGLLRGLLVDLLQDGLRRAVDQVLGLLEAQAGERAHLLDDLDLLVARALEDDVELVLLLDLFGRGSGAGAASGGHRDRGRGLDVKRLLERLHELGQLKEGHLLERVEQVSAAELRHDRFPSFLSPEFR